MFVGSVAEGVELGSNILHTANKGVLGNLQGGMAGYNDVYAAKVIDIVPATKLIWSLSVLHPYAKHCACSRRAGMSSRTESKSRERPPRKSFAVPEAQR